MLSQVTFSSPPYGGGGGVWKQEGRIKFSSADLDKTVELLFDCILQLLTSEEWRIVFTCLIENIRSFVSVYYTLYWLYKARRELRHGVHWPVAVLRLSSIYIVSNNITSHLVIRQDYAAFLIFFPLTFTFPSSSPITSICSLKTGTRGTTGQYWLYWTLVGNAWQVWAMLYAIWHDNSHKRELC